VTLVALARWCTRARGGERLASNHGCQRHSGGRSSLVPLDTRTLLYEIERTGRLVTIEENPRLCGWGAEIVSIAAHEIFYSLDGPMLRITTPHLPLPSADNLGRRRSS